MTGARYKSGPSLTNCALRRRRRLNVNPRQYWRIPLVYPPLLGQQQLRRIHPWTPKRRHGIGFSRICQLGLSKCPPHTGTQLITNVFLKKFLFRIKLDLYFLNEMCIVQSQLIVFLSQNHFNLMSCRHLTFLHHQVNCKDAGIKKQILRSFYSSFK